MKKLIAAALTITLLSLMLLNSWSALKLYEPGKTIELKGNFRTMSEHDDLMRGKNWPYIVRLSDENSELLYYGSRHTSDPQDSQIGEIQTLWAEFKPTVAVTENRLGFFVGSFDMGISAFGEFACASWLGDQDDIEVYSLEPSWEIEVAEMCGEFEPAEVTLFYTMRVFLSERGTLAGEELEALAAHLLAKRGSRPGLEGSLTDLAAVDSLWDDRFREIGPWRIMPKNSADPSANPSRLGKLANLANEVRDRHAARVIIDLLGRGERVFAIAGGSHVVKQEPVIRAGRRKK